VGNLNSTDDQPLEDQFDELVIQPFLEVPANAKEYSSTEISQGPVTDQIDLTNHAFWDKIAVPIMIDLQSSTVSFQTTSGS